MTITNKTAFSYVTVCITVTSLRIVDDGNKKATYLLTYLLTYFQLASVPGLRSRLVASSGESSFFTFN